MVNQTTHSRSSSGRFAKGMSGNLAGRPRGSSGHTAELKRLEEDALKLAVNTAEVIGETARLALVEIELPELIPLFDAITGAAKTAVKDGVVGPSSIALLRTWYDDHRGDDGRPSDGAFFVHVGLPVDCGWSVFLAHYRTLGRIDHSRHAEDLRTFPPIIQRIAELKAEHLLTPVSSVL